MSRQSQGFTSLGGKAPDCQKGKPTYSHNTHCYKKLKSQMQVIYKRIPAEDQWLESESPYTSQWGLSPSAKPTG